MPSPDVSRYVDLTILDPDSQTIFGRALDYALFALPEYQPREGTLELAMLQAMAIQVQEAVLAINRLPGAMTQVMLGLLDVERESGSLATAIAKFTGTTTTSFSVPTGTRMYYIPNLSAVPLLLETTESVTGSHVKQIASISQSGTLITVTTATYHGLVTGDTVSISGTSNSNLHLNNAAATVSSATTFTVTSGSSLTITTLNSGQVTPASTIPATAFVAVRAVTAESTFNGLAAGTSLNLLTVSPSIATVSLATTLLGGAEAETDDEYFSRATATMNRLSTALVTARQTEGFVLETGRFSDVYRVRAVDNTRIDRIGNVAGNMLVAVAPLDASPTNLLSGTGDGTLDPTDSGYGVLDAIYDSVKLRSHASIDMGVVHPSFVTIKVEATVKLPEGTSSAAVSDACIATLDNYMSANTWTWENIIRANEIIVLLRNTTITTGTLTTSATPYVISVEMTPTDVWAPSTSELNRHAISSISRSSGTVTVVTTTTSGIIVNDETLDLADYDLFLKVENTGVSGLNTTTLVEAASAGLSAGYLTFTYAQAGTNQSASTGFITAMVARDKTTGDIVIIDPAPLVLAGEHVITAV